MNGSAANLSRFFLACKSTGRNRSSSDILLSELHASMKPQRSLGNIIEQAGEDGLVIGTDYGHTDRSSDGDAIKVLRARTDLSNEVKQKGLE